MAPKHPQPSPLEEIRRLRAEYTRGDAVRATMLAEALERKRAELVADRILALEAELS